MTQDPLAEIQQHLGTGERVLWAGRPKGGFLLRTSDWLMIPFSLLWGGFAIFWEVAALGIMFVESAEGTDAPPLAIALFFPLFGIPFVAVGLYMIVGRFWVDKRQRENTVYGVTTERVLIRSGVRTRRLTSLSAHSLGEITLAEKPDGCGTISFGCAYPWGGIFQGMTWWPGASRFAGSCLDSIPQAKEVYILIRQVQLECCQKTERGAPPNSRPPSQLPPTLGT